MVLSIVANSGVYGGFESEWVAKWSALHDTLYDLSANSLQPQLFENPL